MRSCQYGMVKGKKSVLTEAYLINPDRRKKEVGWHQVSG